MSAPSSEFRNGSQIPAASSRRMKCSYPDCFRYFASEKEMRRHKKKEPDHEYCHRCDVDCEDDSELLIHMIESGRHIVCPMCGMEFKSNAGLEAHIPQTHQQAQDMHCIGCKEKFTRAAGLMKHIEDGECHIITQEAFQRRRAEKAITKDAWAAQLDPGQEIIPRGSNPTFSDAEGSTEGGVSLMDEKGLREIAARNSAEQDYLTPSMKFLSVRDQQYPSLPNVKPVKLEQAADQEQISNGTSLDTNHGQNAWDPDKPLSRAFSPPLANSESMNPQACFPSIDRKGDLNKSNGVAVPVSPTDAHEYVTTQAAPLTPARILDPMTCFNSLTNRFECPGARCRGIFTSADAFNDHLTSSAHLVSYTICPSCLRRFGSTKALVAHCEAPSKRCDIRKRPNFNQVLRDITGGLIGTEGHHIDGSVRYIANDISKEGFW